MGGLKIVIIIFPSCGSIRSAKPKMKPRGIWGGNASNNALSLGIHLLYQNINIPPNKITGILWFSSDLKVTVVSGIRRVTVTQHAKGRLIPTLPHRLLYILKQTKQYSHSHKRGTMLFIP